MGTVKIPFNKFFPLTLTLLLAVYIELNIKNFVATLFPTYSYLSDFVWIASITVLLLIILLVFKFLLPFINTIPAIEMDNNGITDSVRNVKFQWMDIKAINIQTGKSSSNLIITLNNQKTHTLYLSFVNGKNSEIYNKVKQYFEHA